MKEFFQKEPINKEEHLGAKLLNLFDTKHLNLVTYSQNSSDLI